MPPESFDPLPARSPGMYPEGEERADRSDILVDDEGHPADLTARAQAVAERVKVKERLRGTRGYRVQGPGFRRLTPEPWT
jgi:hypothetical protein